MTNYFYHVTRKKNIRSICKKGLKQSLRGFEGKGTYMAITPQKTLGFTLDREKDKVMIRVSKHKLFNKFGKFDSVENPSGKVEGDFRGEDDGTIVVRGDVPKEFIEYKEKGRWKKC